MSNLPNNLFPKPLIKKLFEDYKNGFPNAGEYVGRMVDETSLMANKVFDYSGLNINIRSDLEKSQMGKIKELGYPQLLQGT